MCTEIHVVNVYVSYAQGTVCFCDDIQGSQNLNMLYSGILLGKSGRLSRTNDMWGGCVVYAISYGV